MSYRPPVIKKDKAVYVDIHTHAKLRKLKRVLRKSMMQIVKDTIEHEYFKVVVQKIKTVN